MRMNKTKITKLAIILLIATLTFWALAFTAYQYSWASKYASNHLKIAEQATDPTTALQELNRAKEILQLFPKEGNSDPIATDPKCDLHLAWKSLDEIIAYAETVPSLKDPYEIEHAMYELRDRITGYLDQRFPAFEASVFWKGQIFGVLSIVTYAIGIIFSFALLSPSIEKKSRISKVALLLYIVVAIGGIILVSVPVLYTGLR